MTTIESKLEELNSIDLTTSPQLSEFVYRINKYTNAILSNQFSASEFEILLHDFDQIKSLIEDQDDLEKINQIESIKEILSAELNNL
jgi:hypothetical protein